MGLEIVIVLLVLLAAALYVLPPLLRPEPEVKSSGQGSSKELAQAASRRDAVYEALTDLEQDYAHGKLSAEDYAQLKRDYQRDAVAALRELDDLAPDRPDIPVDQQRKTSP